MSKEIAKAYEPNKYEKEIYKMWEDGGYFRSEIDENKEPFVIMMPPPNATGVLHLGHALGMTVEDLVIRYKRMQGYNALWLPGTDHAAIATQTKVEKIIAKEGLSREKLGREKFLDRVKEYVAQSRDTIRAQIRAMGSSCDWSREAYTFSPELSVAVNTAFKKMYEDGLIYRGNRIVNWCPRCSSTLADDEVEYEEEKTVLYTFKYDKNFPISIATTRPETKLGDTAVAVNPDDDRYKQYVGQTLEATFCGQKLKLKIIADEGVDKDFGTGALGVTPAHSQVDFDMAGKHDLPVIKIIDEEGKMNQAAGSDFVGLTVKEARGKVIDCLQADGLIEKEEEIDHNLSICYRCDTAVEPLTSEQWFVDVNKKVSGWNCDNLKLEKGQDYSIKDVSLHVVKSGLIKFMPGRMENIYFNWMENLRDWCVSRQIWWGHQIPVWYRQDGRGGFETRPYKDNDIHVGSKPPEEGDWVQDEDTLDTWFSSGLWTFSTLGWPDNTPELKYYHPTQLMETMYDIIFFWVARMIIMTTYLMGEIPFEKVYFHGMIVDEKGKKMSKSSGTGIDPVEVINQYGADALRLSLMVGNPVGNDMHLREEKIIGQRNFVNKLWNVARFVMGNIEEDDMRQKVDVKMLESQGLTTVDKWILSRLDGVTQLSIKHLDNYKLSLALEEIQNFVWHDLADWYIEMVKGDLYGDDGVRKKTVNMTLLYVLRNVLILLHPFVPYVTEVLWEYFMPTGADKLIRTDWVKPTGMANSPLNAEFERIKEVITSVRSMIHDCGLENEKDIKLFLKFNQDGVDKDYLVSMCQKILRNIGEIEIVEEFADNLIVTAGATVDSGVVVPEEIRQREKDNLLKEIDQLKKYVQGLDKKLSNERYLQNAPAEVVERDKDNLAEAKAKLEACQSRLASLGK